jgi:glucokinase
MIPVFISKTRKPFKNTTLLAGDIGATKSNLAVIRFNGESFTIIDQKIYHTKEFTDLQGMLKAFVPIDNQPEVISLGVAGPVQNDKVTLTNIPIDIDASVLSQQWDGIPVLLLNDIEATAFGLGTLKPEDTHTLHIGKEGTKGNMAIIAPEVGLGEAGLFWDGDSHYPYATEGGHCDFAPRTAFDFELYTFLQKKYGHVSWERVISESGIYAIFQFLRDKKERDEPAWLAEKLLVHNPASVIGEYATACSICSETMELFFRYLAYESANVSLKHKASGGIYLGGNLLRHNIHLLDKHIFHRNFCSSGRLNSFLDAVPVHVLANDKIVILGAAYYATHIAVLDPSGHLATL